MNIVVKDSPWTKRDLEIIYEDEEVIFVDNIQLPTLLAQLKVYKSASQARQAGRVGEIPAGYTELKASKKRTLYIWNPTE